MAQVEIHFVGGQSARTNVEMAALKNGGYFDETEPSEIVRALRDYVERALNAPARPHWVWIGEIYVFSQAVSGVVPIGLEGTG